MGLRQRVPQFRLAAPINPRLVTLAISSGRRQGELAQRVDLASSLPIARSGQKISNRRSDKFSVRLIIIDSDEA
jgi:hypothetical protein